MFIAYIIKYLLYNLYVYYIINILLYLRSLVHVKKVRL